MMTSLLTKHWLFDPALAESPKILFRAPFFPALFLAEKEGGKELETRPQEILQELDQINPCLAKRSHHKSTVHKRVYCNRLPQPAFKMKSILPDPQEKTRDFKDNF